ncbi:PKS_KS domain-containing protein [Gammaproteobacteria bacterium]
MHTVAGTECDFDCERSTGYTESINRGWTNCVDNSDIQHVYKCIQKTIDRAIKNAGFDINSGGTQSLIIASNFFENRFWEINDGSSISHDGNYIIVSLKKDYPVNGMILCNSTACSSGASAIVTACQIIDDNKTDIVIVIGYDIESEIPKNGMKRIGAISKDKIAPFSSGRTGTDLADGIGVLIIESSASVEKRSANVFASIIGYGISSDAYNVTMPDPSGASLIKAMKNSIKMSNISVNEIKYINSHGSGTKLNDVLETKAIKEVFMDHAHNLFINSSKSLIGHTLGAAGIIEVVITVMQMNKDKLHPTANFSGNDVECDLNYCFEKSIDCDLKYAISNSIGFGGANVCILLERGAGYEKKNCNI